MEELIKNWKDYLEVLSVSWNVEVERAKKINENALKNNLPGFEFPQRDTTNTPSLEGFMDYLINKYK